MRLKLKGLSKKKRQMLMVHNPHSFFQTLFTFIFTITGRKRPPEDNGTDTDSAESKGHLRDQSAAAKPTDRQKHSKPTRRTSKIGPAHKRSKVTSTEGDEILTGECTIEIMQEDRLQVINRKQKMVKQSSLRFGPFDFSEDTEWEEFLEKVAAACEATCEGLVIQSLCWKWMKPANSSLVPLCSIAGFTFLKKKLTGSQPMIVLIMKLPQALASQKPVHIIYFTVTIPIWL